MGTTRTVLVIAGSDSSGGAGIAADLEALEGCGIRLALTAVTAQGAGGRLRVDPVPLDGLRAQLQAAGPVDAVKIGMLVDADRARVVGGWLAGLDPRPPVVLDPVIRATSGGRLLDPGGVRALEALLPAVDLLTPNRDEAQALAGGRPVEAWVREAPCAILLTGGEGPGHTATDRLFHAGRWIDHPHPRLPGAHRGTGCRLASRIARGLAQGEPLPEAVEGAIGWLAARLAAQSGTATTP